MPDLGGRLFVELEPGRCGEDVASCLRLISPPGTVIDAFLLREGEGPAEGPGLDDTSGLLAERGLPVVIAHRRPPAEILVFNQTRDRELLRARRWSAERDPLLLSAPVFEATEVRALSGLLPLERLIVTLYAFVGRDELRAFNGRADLETPCDYLALEAAEESLISSYTLKGCREVVAGLAGVVAGFCLNVTAFAGLADLFTGLSRACQAEPSLVAGDLVRRQFDCGRPTQGNEVSRWEASSSVESIIRCERTQVFRGFGIAENGDGGALQFFTAATGAGAHAPGLKDRSAR